MTAREPRNPLYFLLLLVGVLFVITALAYAIVPVLEQKAVEAGEPPPPSEFRDALRQDGWRWLLGEVGVLIVVGIASMMLDRYRSLRGAPSPPPQPSSAREEEKTAGSQQQFHVPRGQLADKVAPGDALPIKQGGDVNHAGEHGQGIRPA